MRPLFARRLVLLATLLGLPAFAVAQSPAAPAARQERITFLHVNDVYQHAPQRGRGGLAELQTLVTRLRAEASGPVLFTFGGDLFSPSLASSVTQGRHMVALFNALAPAAAVVGNHEFDFGPEVAAENFSASRFPWLAANMHGGDGQPFTGTAATHLLTTEGGVRIGFVGVITPDTAHASNPRGLRFSAPEAALRSGVEALRAAGAELVVALTHLDLAEDRRLAALPDLGVDLILGGHDHDAVSLLESGPLIIKAGQDARHLAVVELTLDRAAPVGRRVTQLGWRFIPVEGLPPEPRLGAAVAEIEAQLDAALGRPLARLTEALDSRSAVVRTREAAIGNLMADALRQHFRADAALLNGGGLRGNREYPAGHNFTRRDLVTEMPFGNSAVLLEVTGAQLRAALEHGLSAAPEAAGRFPQTSGLRLTYDPAAPAGTRIRTLSIGGAPLDPAARYRLATLDFLARGGDGYAMLREARVLVDASGGPLVVNVIAEALEGSGRIGATPDGRIVAMPVPVPVPQ